MTGNSVKCRERFSRNGAVGQVCACEASLGPTYIHQSCIDVVAALPVYGNEERKASVRRKAIHEAVLILVSRQQSDTAVFGLRLRSHRI